MRPPLNTLPLLRGTPSYSSVNPPPPPLQAPSPLLTLPLLIWFSQRASAAESLFSADARSTGDLEEMGGEDAWVDRQSGALGS